MPLMRTLLVWACVVLLCCGVSALARADTYEWERTHKLLVQKGYALDSAPEGKTIAWVRVVRDDVFVEDEVWPTWFNFFHWRTRDEVVRRELLFEVGQPVADALLEESMRNLRGMGIFALVRIVAVRTADPQAVGIVVHTRDLWSLRLEQDFNITRQIDNLSLRLIERNLAGRQKNIGVEFTLVPRSYTLRQFYYARRVWGAPISLTQSASVTFNRQHGGAEGSAFSAMLGRPYFNLKQRYAYALEGGYSTTVTRQLVSGEVDRYTRDGTLFANRVFRQQYRMVGVSGSLRRGQHFKQTFGTSFSYRELDAFAVGETALPRELRQDFERDVLPLLRREIGPSLSYSIFTPRFAIFQNLGTFGQSENVTIGPYLTTAVRAPLKVFGSSSDSWILSGTMGWVLAPGGGLLEVATSASTRYEDGKLVDQFSMGLLRGATPVFAKLRLVSRTVIEARRNDTARTLVSLGANNGLRGYPSQSVFGYGAGRILQNVELRTLPLEWQAVHIGGVVFFDVGSVHQTVRDLRWHYAAGVGLRVFFPQFNRYPFILDGGAGIAPRSGFTPTFKGGQVVPLTATEDALEE